MYDGYYPYMITRIHRLYFKELQNIKHIIMIEKDFGLFLKRFRLFYMFWKFIPNIIIYNTNQSVIVIFEHIDYSIKFFLLSTHVQNEPMITFLFNHKADF